MDARTLAALAADAWAARHGRRPLCYERPDELHRQGPAIDLLGRDPQGRPRLVLEHTLVESFLDQRTAQIAAFRMFQPLEGELSGQLPALGHYEMAVKPSSVLGLKREASRIREWVAEWIRRTAPRLSIGGSGGPSEHWATVAIPDTGLEVSLYRWQGDDPKLHMWFDAPPEDEDVLTPSLERAIRLKCPKLAAAKAANPGAASVLLLEISDISLGSLLDLDAVVQVRFTSRAAEAPDHIWLVDTTDDPPSLLISKEGARTGHPVRERLFPFALRPVGGGERP